MVMVLRYMVIGQEMGSLLSKFKGVIGDRSSPDLSLISKIYSDIVGLSSVRGRQNNLGYIKPMLMREPQPIIS